jgi:hypothetical protein
LISIGDAEGEHGRPEAKGERGKSRSKRRGSTSKC